jgi:hypothetical protein
MTSLEEIYLQNKMFSAKRKIWHMDFLENKTSHLKVTASNPKGGQHKSYKALLYVMWSQHFRPRHKEGLESA